MNRRGYLGDFGIDGIKMDLKPFVRAFEFSCLPCPAVVFLNNSKSLKLPQLLMYMECIKYFSQYFHIQLRYFTYLCWQYVKHMVRQESRKMLRCVWELLKHASKHKPASQSDTTADWFLSHPLCWGSHLLPLRLRFLCGG